MMRATALSLLLGVALALAACGNAAGGRSRTPATPARRLRRDARAPGRTGPAQNRRAGLAKRAAPESPRIPNEDGSETVEDATGDSGAHNALLAAVASTVAAAAPAAAARPTSPPTLWQEGVNYTRMVPAQPTAVAPGQVEVLEFFWYACPHCYALDPLVESWRKTKPAYISFSRVPVTWSDGHRSLARLYYTCESLGKLEQMHSEIFKEIQVNGDPLVAPNPSDEAATERIQAAFAAKEGIPEATFRNEYEHGFSMDQRSAQRR